MRVALAVIALCGTAIADTPQVAVGTSSVTATSAPEIEAIVPGGTAPTPVGATRIFAIGTRFRAASGCRLDGAAAVGAPGGAAGDAAVATHAGTATLACGSSTIALVIAPVIVAAHVDPLRAGAPTIVHVAIASSADVGRALDVTADPDFTIDHVAPVASGLDVTITARVADRRGVVRIAANAIELGRIEIESIAAGTEDRPTTAPDWLAWELGGQVGVFSPFGLGSGTNIGHPKVPSDVVDWGPMLGGRAGIFPTRRVGLEAELAFVPSAYEAQPGTSALVMARAQVAVRIADDHAFGLRLVGGADLVAQLASAGTSQRGVTGGVHVGAAFSIEVADRTYLRLEVLDVILPAIDFDYAHCLEVQFGVMRRFGRIDRWLGRQ